MGLLYTPKEDQEEEGQAGGNDDSPTQVNLLIAKHRNGPTGEIRLVFFRAYTRFESAAPADDEEIPENRA